WRCRASRRARTPGGNQPETRRSCHARASNRRRNARRACRSLRESFPARAWARNPSDRAFSSQLGDLAVIEAELDQDLARMLAQLRRAAADGAAAPAVGPHRELGIAALG